MEAKVNQRIDDLKNINLAYEKIELEIAERQIKTNIREKEFLQIITELKRKIAEGDMF
ncbi:anthranilate/para-aminobenzoate synthase component I [Staphylococcus capitis]